VVEHAGLSDRVHVEIGTISDRLPAIHKKYGLSGPLGAVLLDHNTTSYLPDLQLLEKNEHINKTTVVLCDWSLYPGSSDKGSAPTDGENFMQYLTEIGVSQSTRHSKDGKELFTVSAGSWVGVV
jgi:predicted O-methyltransferase YrrM